MKNKIWDLLLRIATCCKIKKVFNGIAYLENLLAFLSIPTASKKCSKYKTRARKSHLGRFSDKIKGCLSYKIAKQFGQLKNNTQESKEHFQS